MGSLNANGSYISQSRQSLYKNGRGHKITADRLEVETLVGPTPAQLSSQMGTMPDLVTSQNSIYLAGDYIRTTQSLTDDDVESNVNRHDVVASEQPELAKIIETQKSAKHTGNRVVVSDTKTDLVDSREYDTSFLPGG
jgi:hypothetical protein